jgi:phage tail protein X
MIKIPATREGLPAIQRCLTDGIAEFVGATTPLEKFYIVVEIDRGTESLSVLEGKLAKYVGVAHDGRVDALWIVVGSGERRRSHIEELLARQGLADWARVLEHAFIIERPVLELPPRERR